MGIPNDLIYYDHDVCKERKYSPPQKTLSSLNKKKNIAWRYGYDGNRTDDL